MLIARVQAVESGVEFPNMPAKTRATIEDLCHVPEHGFSVDEFFE